MPPASFIILSKPDVSEFRDFSFDKATGKLHLACFLSIYSGKQNAFSIQVAVFPSETLFYRPLCSNT